MKVKEMVCSSQYEDMLRMIQNHSLKKQGGKSFLITGGNGFIMYYLVLTLLCMNDENHNGNVITLMVRSQDRAAQRYGALLKRSDLRVMVQDVCEPIRVEESFDYIVHAASGASAQQFDEDPVGIFNANVLGTENLITFIRRKPCVSMTYVSSFTVYGNGTEKQEVIDEDFRGPEDWNSNRASYSYGKRAAEFLCGAAWRKYACPIRVIRPGFVYGGSSPNDNRVYSEIIRNVAEHQPIVLQSAGHVYRSMIYVTDVVRGIFACLFDGENGEAYNAANEFVSIQEFAVAAVKVNPAVCLMFKNEADKALPAPQRPGGAMSTKKLTTCGWHPEVSLTDGIAMGAEIYSYRFL